MSFYLGIKTFYWQGKIINQICIFLSHAGCESSVSVINVIISTTFPQKVHSRRRVSGELISHRVLC